MVDQEMSRMAKEKSPREKSTPKSGTPAGMREGMKKATTGMLVLFLLQQKPMYTYDIMRRVEEITKGALTFNTLYIAIYRLKEFGYVE